MSTTFKHPEEAMRAVMLCDYACCATCSIFDFRLKDWCKLHAKAPFRDLGVKDQVCADFKFSGSWDADSWSDKDHRPGLNWLPEQ